jgi:hypothetical protein
LLPPMGLPLTALHYVKKSSSVSSLRVCFSSSRTIPSMMMPPRRCQVSGNESARGFISIHSSACIYVSVPGPPLMHMPPHDVTHVLRLAPCHIRLHIHLRDYD